jgi:hypothetical protein
MNPDDILPRWIADSVEVIDAPDSMGKIFKISNAQVINNKKEEVIRIPGKTYIGETQLYLWHFLYDDIAQYVYLKKHIPDLNLFLFAPKELRCSTKSEFLEDIKHMNFHQRHEEKSENGPHKYFEDILPLFLTQEHLPNLFKGNYSFEEIYFVYDSRYYFSKLADLVKAGLHWFNVPYAFWLPFGTWEERADIHRAVFNEFWWRDIGMLEMKKIFLEQIKDYPTDTPKKIFVSRRDAHKRHKATSDPGPISQRVVDERLNNRIEEAFEANGYEMVHLEGMGYFDQLNLFRNATHVAGLSGTGLCQTLVCGPNTFLTQIFATKLYGFSYKFIPKSIGFKIQSLTFTNVKQLDKIKEIVDKHCAYADSFIEARSKLDDK